MTRFRWVLAILTITVVGILAPSLTGARVFLGTDLLEAFSPWSTEAPDDVDITNPLIGDTVDARLMVLMSERLRSGDITPLWDGYTHGGQPAASVPSHSLYSPLNLGSRILPGWFAPVAAKLLELAAAIGFTFLFLRSIGLSRFASSLAGLIFAFSGFQVVWTNWPQAHIGALIPGLFWAIEYALAKRTVVSITPLAGVVAAMWLEGFPSVTVYALTFAGAYALVRILTDRSLRTTFSGYTVTLGGVIAGTAIAAFQLIPFAYWVTHIETSTRAQEPNWYLARRTLATLAVPNAFGSPVDRYYGPAEYLIYGPVNYVEIQAFIGIAALGLIAVAAVYGRRVIRTPIIAYLWASIASITVVMYAASPLLDLIHSLPLIGTNHIGRLRSVFLFLLAVLVGIGAEALIRRLPSRSNRVQRAGLAAAIVVIGAIIGWGLSKAAEMASEADRTDYFRGKVAVAVIVAIVVVVLVVAAHGAGRLSASALWILPVVAAIEIALFALPYWPQVPRDQFYPTTVTHEFLLANLEGERVAATDIALYPSTTTFYGIRSVTGHAFAPTTWKEALVAVDPDAFRFSETFTTLRTSPEIARSPLLDRLSARYVVAPAGVPLLGTERRSVGALPDVIVPGRTLQYPITSAPAAGVAIPLPTGHDPGAGTSIVTVEVIDDAGTVLSAATRRIPEPLGPTELLIGVPTTDGGATIRIAFAGDAGLVVESRPLDLVTAFPDLPVVFGGSTTIYERRNALERIRWASSSVTMEDPAERLALLATGLDRSTVVLSAPSMAGEGGEGSIDVVVDDARDSIVLDVSADGPGYVVVADSLQIGWSATMDGISVDLLEADHVGVGVAMPAGTHRVVLSADPDGWNAGLVVSATSGAVLVAIIGIAVLRRRAGAAPSRDAP